MSKSFHWFADLFNHAEDYISVQISDFFLSTVGTMLGSGSLEMHAFLAKSSSALLYLEHLIVFLFILLYFSFYFFPKCKAQSCLYGEVGGRDRGSSLSQVVTEVFQQEGTCFLWQYFGLFRSDKAKSTCVCSPSKV